MPGSATLACGQTKLPKIFGDHMVVQENTAVHLWGWDNPGVDVTAKMGGAGAIARSGPDGAWSLYLPPRSAGGPFELTVKGSSEIKITDVLVGEVWLCSGQSNMEMEVSKAGNATEEIAHGAHPEIRHFKVNHAPAAEPAQDVESNGWQVASPETVGEFTAAGYFFACELQKQLHVPIGIIGSNWGGTRIEPWTPPEGFRSNPALHEISDALDTFPQKNDKGDVNHQSPLALYNGMIHPLVGYRIRGILWYQGEANVGDGMQYFEKMKALVAGWRAVFKNQLIPFYYVQLAPYHYNKGDGLPEIWQAQLSAISIPYSGMIVTTDIGNYDNIHPTNKQEVGRRLALWALAQTYGRLDVVCSGPLFQSARREGAKLRLDFAFGQGLTTRDGQPPTEFAVAGDDGQFSPAQATIEGHQVVCWSDAVAAPIQVRFGWSENANPNLVNAAGLPASPFSWKPQ